MWSAISKDKSWYKISIKVLLATVSLYSFKKELLETLTFWSNYFLGVIARMKPGVDGMVYIAIEVGENVGTI